MIKMSSISAASLTILAIVSVAYGDVSHLNGFTYHTPAVNQLGTALFKLHTFDAPASTQYHGTYGSLSDQPQLPNSYVPPASGSPFQNSDVPSLPIQYPSQQYSTGTQQSVYPNQGSVFQSGQYHQQSANQPSSSSLSSYQQSAYQGRPQQAAYQPQLQSHSSAIAYQQSAQQNLEPIITKHFYVHAAPEDPEEDAGPRYVHVGRPRKDYKIIFIKAPSYSSRSQIIPILPQNEQKTIVYVLSKKPSFKQDIQLPEQPVTEPSKPEVFFIKYKTQQEADQAQKSIQAAYDAENANLANATGDEKNKAFNSNAGSFSNSGTGLSSSSFGGQETIQQNYHQQHQQEQSNQHGGHYSSTAAAGSRQHIG